MPYSFGGTHFGHWLEHWPTIESIELSDGVVMLYPNLEPARKIFPVHVSFYEDLHQEEFWVSGRLEQKAKTLTVEKGYRRKKIWLPANP